MSTLLEQLEYGFDRDSRRTWRRRALAAGQDDAYGYDGLSQVLNAARGNLNLNATAIGGVPAGDESWDYDPTGNWRGYRVEADGAVTLEQRRVHDKGNRLTQVEGSAGAVLVDRAGRMTQVPPDAAGEWNQERRMVWDAWSRLVSVADDIHGVTGSYTYDGLNRRMTKTVSGVTWHTYYSDAWRPLEERRDSQTVAARQYYWGVRHRDDLVKRDRATTLGGALDETRYVLMDYFSPAAITDGSGDVTERYAFSAFGVRSIMAQDFSPRSSSECAWEFGFQGQFLDTESGSYDYGYRYYSPSLGRWLSKDPIEEEGGLNLYGFSRNNGVNAVDLLGLQFMTPFFGVQTDGLIRGAGTMEFEPYIRVAPPEIVSPKWWTGPEITPPVPMPIIPPSPPLWPSVPTDPAPTGPGWSPHSGPDPLRPQPLPGGTPETRPFGPQLHPEPGLMPGEKADGCYLSWGSSRKPGQQGNLSKCCYFCVYICPRGHILQRWRIDGCPQFFSGGVPVSGYADPSNCDKAKQAMN